MGHVRAHTPLLASQLALIEAKRADVTLLSIGRGHPPEQDALDALANDLVGARVVIASALLAAPPPHEISGEAREELEGLEREAQAMLGVVTGLLRRGQPPAGRTTV